MLFGGKLFTDSASDVLVGSDGGARIDSLAGTMKGNV
jgi:hypothetical protein